MPSSIERFKVLSAGVISLVLMLGVARFAYTPLLPLMQQQASLGISAGGWLASIHYMGYFTGVLIAAYASAILFGGTFIGIVSLVLTMAGLFMVIGTLLIVLLKVVEKREQLPSKEGQNALR